MSETILKITELSKSYGAKTVLDKVSFEIERGKIYGFIGENGAGKTTALRAITGLSTVRHGKIELFGKTDKKGLIEARRKIGCLVEKPILELNKSAKRNLQAQQLLYGNSDEQRIEQVLARVGLADVKNKKVADFSLGMKQRLGIAMGMVDVRELLISLCRDDGITIVISSHILAELYQLATDYIIISHGRIISTLSKDELDDRCTTHITMDTEHNDEALRVLATSGIRTVDDSDGAIRIFDNVEARDVAQLMYDNKILVTHLAKHERTLEEYYIELLGRGA